VAGNPLTACRVLVTPTTFGRGDPALKSSLEQSVGSVTYNTSGRPLGATELGPLVADIDGWIAGLDRIDADVIAAAPRLKVIARYGVGVDRVDVRAATRHGVVVTNTPGANATAVAEHAIALMLALCRNLCRADRAVRRGEWPRHDGVGLCGKTVGLVGFGAVGREAARRLQAFGCRIVAHDPFLPAEGFRAHRVDPVTLGDLLAAADIVSLHAAYTPGTPALVDDGFLACMRPGAFLVNTARGELVDEEALHRALSSGRLRGAGLDCFRQEPPPAEHPLLRLPQVVATPHTAAHTDEAAAAMGRMALAACLQVLAGERAEHTVNPEVYQVVEKRRLGP
jgi:D-3-phosphoglycerate dehydrogenase / 2-oxoglutarate reductase